MLVIKNGNPCPQLVTHRVLGEMLQTAANCVAARMAGSRIEPEQGRVGKQYQGANTHVSPLTVRISESQDRINCEDDIEDQTCQEEPAMTVLQNQRCSCFTRVRRVRFGNSACWWRPPERTVVGLTVVVAGHAKTKREYQDE